MEHPYLFPIVNDHSNQSRQTNSQQINVSNTDATGANIPNTETTNAMEKMKAIENMQDEETNQQQAVAKNSGTVQETVQPEN